MQMETGCDNTDGKSNFKSNFNLTWKRQQIWKSAKYWEIQIGKVTNMLL